MKVSDIMTKEVVSVKPADRVIDVAELLHQKGLNGVPVVADGKVLGMITEADLVSRGPTSLHIPSLIKVFHSLKIEKYLKEKQDENIHSFFKANAKSVMNPDYVFVSPDTDIMELVKIFQEKHVNPIPVVDERGSLAGVVSLADIIEIVSQFRKEEIDFLSSKK